MCFNEKILHLPWGWPKACSHMASVVVQKCFCLAMNKNTSIHIIALLLSRRRNLYYFSFHTWTSECSCSFFVKAKGQVRIISNFHLSGVETSENRRSKRRGREREGERERGSSWGGETARKDKIQEKNKKKRKPLPSLWLPPMISPDHRV